MTGCYNTNCPGFVQIDHRAYPGIPITPVSIPDGTQYEIALSIAKEEDGNWWVSLDNIRIGYFPPILYDIIIDNKSCYDLIDDGYQGEYMGYAFEFGGPSGQCGN
ncbi:hypothetical protein FCV25MIE_18130 [Fagus crenata]